MSYDFRLFHVPESTDPVIAYKQQLIENERKAVESQSRTNNLSQPRDAKWEEEMRGLAEALTQRHSGLQQAGEHGDASAGRRSIPTDRISSHIRHIELNDLNLGLQIMLFENTGSVTIPFWRLEKRKAEDTLRAAWDCLRMLESKGNFSTYDPQQGKILNLDSDFDLVLSGYAGMIHRVDKTLRKPRWKFW